MMIFLGLLLFFVLVLALPLDVSFDGRWPDAGSNRLVLGWAFGVLSFDINAGGSSSAADADNDDVSTTRQSPSRHKRESSPWPSIWSRALRTPEVRRRIWRFAHDLWSAVHKRDIFIGARIGLETPADTGQLWAVLGPASVVLAAVPECVIAVRPDFDEEAFELTGRGQVRVYPIEVLGVLVALVLSPPLWRLIVATYTQRRTV